MSLQLRRYQKFDKKVVVDIDIGNSDVNKKNQQQASASPVSLHSDKDYDELLDIIENTPHFQTFDLIRLYELIENLPLKVVNFFQDQLKKKSQLQQSNYNIPLLRQLEIVRYSLYQQIFHQGATTNIDAFYIILKGKISIICSKENPYIYSGFQGYYNDLSHQQIHDLDHHVALAYFQNIVVSVLKKGEHFGEIAVISKEKRTMTVISCDTETVLLKVNQDIFNQFFKRQFQRPMTDTIVYMQSNFNLMKEMKISQILSFLNYFELIQYQQNVTIYSQKQYSHFLYFIVRGEIEIFDYYDFSQVANAQIKQLQHSQEKQYQKMKKRVWIVCPDNCFFGDYQYYLGLGNRVTYAQSLTDVTVLRILIQSFEALCEQSRCLNAFQQEMREKQIWVEKQLAKSLEIASISLKIEIPKTAATLDTNVQSDSPSKIMTHEFNIQMKEKKKLLNRISQFLNQPESPPQNIQSPETSFNSGDQFIDFYKQQYEEFEKNNPINIDPYIDKQTSRIGNISKDKTYEGVEIAKEKDKQSKQANSLINLPAIAPLNLSKLSQDENQTSSLYQPSSGFSSPILEKEIKFPPSEDSSNSKLFLPSLPKTHRLQTQMSLISPKSTIRTPEQDCLVINSNHFPLQQIDKGVKFKKMISQIKQRTSNVANKKCRTIDQIEEYFSARGIIDYSSQLNSLSSLQIALSEQYKSQQQQIPTNFPHINTEDLNKAEMSNVSKERILIENEKQKKESSPRCIYQFPIKTDIPPSPQQMKGPLSKSQERDQNFQQNLIQKRFEFQKLQIQKQIQSTLLGSSNSNVSSTPEFELINQSSSKI